MVIKSNNISAYTGGLVASLTYPIRSKEINTFADLLKLPNEATIATIKWSSNDEILKETTDPVLQVTTSQKDSINSTKYFKRKILGYLPENAESRCKQNIWCAKAV